MLLNCGVGEDSWESLGLQGDPTSPHPKGNQSWIFIGRTDAEAEAPILWPPDAKGWRIWKDPDAGKDWRQKEKGMTEDEMLGWHHWLNGHEFEQVPGVGDGQGSLVCFSPWGSQVFSYDFLISLILVVILLLLFPLFKSLPSFSYLWVFFVLSLILKDGRLDCLFEIIHFPWDRPILL